MSEWTTVPLFWVVVWYGVTSLTLFLFYGIDKRAARRCDRRIPETRLHLLALMRGIPGALLAQQVFRHKTRKTSFQLVTWTIVVLHVAFLVGFLRTLSSGWN
jgi:uncharacterized membrane protein YsdA (DUF1294 family)